MAKKVTGVYQNFLSSSTTSVQQQLISNRPLDLEVPRVSSNAKMMTHHDDPTASSSCKLLYR